MMVGGMAFGHPKGGDGLFRATMQPRRKLAQRDRFRRTWAAGRTGQDGSGLVPPAGARLERGPGRKLGICP
ncbi:hypothetical protein BWR17_19695 (plasmid) [Phaeobacter inhibens]|nr:hypothetical protein BWR17_19695 [Phaeobacter inhibens]